MTEPKQHHGFRLPSIVRHINRPQARRSDPGARPGTVNVDPQAPPPKIHVIAYGPDGVLEHDVENVDALPELLNQHPVTWINIDGLGDEYTIKRMAELFNIHRLVQEDIVNVHQHAKVEAYDGQVFIVARMVSLDERLTNEQISMILVGNCVITFQERQGDCLEPVRNRIRQGGGRLREAKADYLVYALLDAVIDGYFPVLEKYGERLERLEDLLLARATSETAAAVHRLRTEFFVLRKSIWPHREAINALMRDSLKQVTAETRLYLRDCYDHTIQLIDITETCREMCSDLRDFHFSQISMRQNEIMKVLTIMATIFIPLGFIAGVYGMNFDPGASPWNMPELKWIYGYPFALGLMALVAVGLLIFFWYRGWLGSEPTWLRLHHRWRHRR